MTIIDIFTKKTATPQPAPQEDTIFQTRLDSEEQRVSALNTVSAGFSAKGGSSLMLTEAVENGVDAIIDLKKQMKVQGKIKVLIDKPNARVMVIDNGTGFLRIKHVCEKPFESIKKFDVEQTGQFARGLHGFRTFCNNLTYITRRPLALIPPDEYTQIGNSGGKTQRTAQIKFEYNTSAVKVKYVDDDAMVKELIDKEHGTVAVYENWRQGEFEKLNLTQMIVRLQHHFGELVRNSDVSIAVEVREGRIADIGPEQEKLRYIVPHDYSEFERISLPTIPYKNNGVESQISFNLYLCDKGASNKWNYPYLLYKNRPVGDGFITGIDEFSDDAIWRHRFLTGYVTCDFCHINELRQGLQPGPERDFLFKELLKVQKILETKVKEHAKGLYELRLQSQVSDLVKDLQLFFKERNIFNFKRAKSMGYISSENPEVEIVELAKKQGDNTETETANPGGEGAAFAGTATFSSSSVDVDTEGEASGLNPEKGMHGDNHASVKVGSPSAPSVSPDPAAKEPGFVRNDDGAQKPGSEEAPHSPGGTDKTGKKGTRHKPKGFGIAFQDDEFNEDLSWFDDVTHMVIINSQHQRFLSRQDETNLKPLMEYLAELYIWEITRLVHGKEEDVKQGMEFLKYKFEYADHVRSEGKKGNDATA